MGSKSNPKRAQWGGYRMRALVQAVGYDADALFEVVNGIDQQESEWARLIQHYIVNAPATEEERLKFWQQMLDMKEKTAEQRRRLVQIANDLRDIRDGALDILSKDSYGGLTDPIADVRSILQRLEDQEEDSEELNGVD